MFSFRVILFYFFNLITGLSIAQNTHVIDSLENILSKTNSNNEKAWVHILLSKEIVDADPEKGMQYAQKAFKLSEQSGNKKYQAVSLHWLGNAYYNLADFKTSLSYYLKALRIAESIKNLEQVATSTSSIGGIYTDQKKLEDALEYFQRALKIYSQIGNKRGVAVIQIYIGNVYDEKKDHKKALEYFAQSLKTFIEVDDKVAMATNYNNLANSYFNLKNYPKSFESLNKALALYEEMDNLYGVALALNNLGDFYNETGDYGKASEYYKKALEKGRQLKANDRILYSYLGLSNSYKKTGDFKGALQYREAYSQLNDSIFNLESNKQMTEMQTKYETAKKEKKIALLSKEKEIHTIESQNQKLIRNALIGLSAIIILFAFWRARIKHIANQKLKQKNQEIEQKNQKLQVAYEIIEDKNKDINDSLNYAKHIQQAILPEIKTINKVFPESYVFYKPKAVVSGDFYFFAQKNDLIYLAAVDCTGHGVPGAFMSMIGHNHLQHLIMDKEILNPSEILNQLNRSIKSTLKQTGSEEETHDGMDLALCVIDVKSKKLEYAGANRPLLIARKLIEVEEPEDSDILTQVKSLQKAIVQLEEIPSNKVAIGGLTSEEYHFSNNSIQLEKGDIIYLYTDGYSDQFGEETNKKFMSKNFKNLIQSIQNKSMEEQKTEIEKVFDNWKGNLEQVDDVLVIGIKI